MEDNLNKTLNNSAEAGKECEALEGEIAALKATYEQYFLGIERTPPSKQHEDIKRRVNRLKTGVVRQTAVKFRIQALQAKFLSYERLWLRTLQEIERGTYRRDVFKAKYRSAKREAPKKPAAAPEAASSRDAALDAALSERPSPKPVAPMTGEPGVAPVAARPATLPGARPAAGAPPSPPATALSDQKLRAVYDAYVTAKKRCAEDTSKLTFESVAANLRKQVPELLKKHNASGVEFKVVIKDGKAILRALPKE